ncbi:MAG: N-acetylglucosamine-6-phosphate deacetylase [Actinomycetota bacterium]
MNAGPEGVRVAGGRVLTPDGWLDADVLLEAGRITRVERPRRAGGDAIDAAGLLVVPGFVDLQVNGGFGLDLTSSPGSLWTLGARLPETGVTAFLPTIVSSPLESVLRALDVLAAGPPEGYAGATPLGWHVEGPMLSPSRRGTHDERHLRAPGLEVIDGWSRTAGARIVTLAPELAGAGPVIRELRERGVVVAIGHSDATFEEAIAAFDAGVGAGTHLFNAMSGFDHRAPGVAGALLARADVVAGLIADGVHVHPAAVATAWRVKGAHGIALVTDAVSAMGAETGIPHPLGGSTVMSDGTSVLDHEGRLAGSVLTLDRAVRNVVAFAGAEPEDAAMAASTTPATVVGEDRRGSIAPGEAADLTLLDLDLRVVATIVAGLVAFDRRAGGALR